MYNNIITYVDIYNKTSWQKSLPVATNFAKNFDATLNILTTVPDFNMPWVEQFFKGDFDKKEVQNTVLTELENFIDTMKLENIKTRAILGKEEVHHSILHACDKLEIDLIIIPAIMKKNHLYNFGTTATAITRYAKCSVLVVK